ncbi:MarR family winged helix-turn-helix transcriptional regulator [Ilumatobacter sp.]|uniref:MarR family winged helix-turn-helix transcriptional regulator n=1 Tax=Ilumatobacter sp. TaxID=1967498 RepID=UPI003C4D9A0E
MPLDRVDEIVEQWKVQRPDLDTSGMAIIGRLARLERQIRPLLDDVFERHDLESWEFDVLATLLRSGDPHQLTPGRLLESTMVTSGAMTNRLDRLERRGLVRRSKSPDDGRQVLVTLTEPGRTVVDRAVTDHAENERRIVGAMSADERRELTALLRRLQIAVEQANDD